MSKSGVRVAQIVEANALLEPCCDDCRLELATDEVGVPDGRSLGRDEDEIRSPQRATPLHVCHQFVDERRRQRHRSPLVVLRLADDALPAHFACRLRDGDASADEVEVPHPQRLELAGTQAREGGHEDHRPPVVADGMGKAPHLLGVEEVHLGLARPLWNTCDYERVTSKWHRHARTVLTYR